MLLFGFVEHISCTVHIVCADQILIESKSNDNDFKYVYHFVSLDFTLFVAILCKKYIALLIFIVYFFSFCVSMIDFFSSSHTVVQRNNEWGYFNTIISVPLKLSYCLIACIL